MTKGAQLNCNRCDSPGGEKTFRHQVSMPIDGRVQCIDFCIHPIIATSTRKSLPLNSALLGGRRGGQPPLSEICSLLARAFAVMIPSPLAAVRL